ncbi:Hypothetical predicted protein [Paramuricea clavata]|uniref:Reverse transcriptase domain-containing protein n=1 Tax=Paramuricea clavata TaxID=317549 RepID=A0A7D9E7T0_PARCT|nr:Hypothetical predicted protein [Paramuricea clavata]
MERWTLTLHAIISPQRRDFMLQDTKHDHAFILGLGFCKKFKLVTISPVCVQQHTISVEPNKVEAVHITSESDVNYNELRKKWKEHIPLGKKTDNPLEDLKKIFPETFDRQVDTRSLNKYLIRNVHYTASWEDAQHSFNNGQYFSTLDAKSWYWTKQLDKQSQLLTAFNTPFKKYCFLRLPFGLSASSEIFCEQMDRVLCGILGTFPCADDVKVQGSTEERHDIHLLETVEKACQAGLKFNPEKCVIKKEEIEYFGRVISPQGPRGTMPQESQEHSVTRSSNGQARATKSAGNWELYGYIYS